MCEGEGNRLLLNEQHFKFLFNCYLFLKLLNFYNLPLQISYNLNFKLLPCNYCIILATPVDTDYTKLHFLVSFFSTREIYLSSSLVFAIPFKLLLLSLLSSFTLVLVTLLTFTSWCMFCDLNIMLAGKCGYRFLTGNKVKII